jgi:hypothetical protein
MKAYCCFVSLDYGILMRGMVSKYTLRSEIYVGDFVQTLY